jgi:hypothetical protein
VTQLALTRFPISRYTGGDDQKWYISKYTRKGFTGFSGFPIEDHCFFANGGLAV